MTTWDATAKDLADALTARGRRPLDADHLFTCAVEALEDLDDMVSQEDHEHVVKGFRSDLEEMERNEQTASDRADEVERERDELQEQIDELQEQIAALESERDDLQVENTNLREALDGDAEVLVGQVARLKRDLESEREETRGLLARLRERLVSLQRYVDVPRISKATVSVNLRDVVAVLDREIARASAK